MARITPLQLRIKNAHLEAKRNKNFTFVSIPKSKDSKKPSVDREALIEELLKGSTFQSIMEIIEGKYCPMTGIMLNSLSDGYYESKSYKSGLNRGFRELLNNFNIQ